MKKFFMIFFAVLLVLMVSSTVWAAEPQLSPTPTPVETSIPTPAEIISPATPGEAAPSATYPPRADGKFQKWEKSVTPHSTPDLRGSRGLQGPRGFRGPAGRPPNQGEIQFALMAMRNSVSSGSLPREYEYALKSAEAKGWVEIRKDGSFKWLKNPSDIEISGLLTYGMQKEIRADRQVLGAHKKMLQNHEGRLQVVEGKLGINPAASPSPAPVASATVQIATPSGAAGWIGMIWGWLIATVGNVPTYVFAIIAAIILIGMVGWLIGQLVVRLWNAFFGPQNPPAQINPLPVLNEGFVYPPNTIY